MPLKSLPGPAPGRSEAGPLPSGDDQPLAELLDELVAEGDDFRKVVAGVDVQERERQPRLLAAGELERLLRQVQDDARVLAAREQQGRAFERGRDFAKDEDGFFFQPVEVAVVHGRQQVLR